MKAGWMGLVACSALGFAAQAQAQTCAYMFQGVNFGGEVLEVQDGDQVPAMGSWNNRVSSVKVAEKCELYVFDAVSYLGEDNRLGAPEIPDLGPWKNRISSYYCICSPGRARD
ncbi:peptidase inhibitor family I36 protein [Polyangium jinanense]|uniref:Beta/gamma crystallin 'Greek key' domain-containing protein n=1 Tax=Polyangium jinanense TaxID=2829994 RepID=A0A9X3XDN0_9BACT|nr:peptidase inhibitor family I36 protein [Polyangium jinanense]MDC3988704.1 hypothetical protein [Polyangium jinanense]